jgi:hypothetical protein
MDSKAWNRKVLNAYWLLLLIVLAAQIWGLYMIPSEDSLVFKYYLRGKILSDLFLLTIMAGVELLYRYMETKFEYVLILLGIYIASILFIFNQEKDIGIQITFILPILMSIYYFSTKIIVFAGVSTLLSCFIIFPIFLQDSYENLVIEIISTSAMVIGTCLFAFLIKIRGLGLIVDQQSTRNTNRI